MVLDGRSANQSVIADEMLQSRWIQERMQEVADKGIAGINFDLEDALNVRLRHSCKAVESGEYACITRMRDLSPYQYQAIPQDERSS